VETYGYQLHMIKFSALKILVSWLKLQQVDRVSKYEWRSKFYIAGGFYHAECVRALHAHCMLVNGSIAIYCTANYSGCFWKMAITYMVEFRSQMVTQQCFLNV